MNGQLSSFSSLSAISYCFFIIGILSSLPLVNFDLLKLLLLNRSRMTYAVVQTHTLSDPDCCVVCGCRFCFSGLCGMRKPAMLLLFLLLLLLAATSELYPMFLALGDCGE